MKTYSFLLVLAVCIPALLFGQSPVSQKAVVLKRTIELNHLSPRVVDDSFSRAVFNTIIKNLDRRSLYFTDADYKKLAAFNNKLDDELNGKASGFFELLEPLYKKALVRADSIINKQLQKQPDFSVIETISTSKEASFQFAADIPALNNRWSRYLKYMLLDQLYEIASADSTGKATIKTTLTSQESKIRERIRQAESNSVKRILEHPAGFSAYLAEVYLNAVAMCFDPHSNYFSPEQKEEFKESLSTEELSFGVDLDENESGNIVIDQITPGGPAWKSGDINKGDQLISLLWEGKEVVDMAGLSLEDAYEMLEQSVDGRLVLKIKKADGTIRTVLLRKEKIENEENIVKSFILQGEKKIGYILLPSFYTEWENETGSSCANDVAKEIVKLKRDNIDGLILDVRYNGGGSLGEAMDMIGIFVDEGPLMGQQQKTGKVQFLKDPNRGTIYNGPLGLMINGQSASASEILAASLQDYNRAVVIGSNSFGKATMQQMFGLDTNTRKPMMGAPDKDMVKITTGKLYRLNGESAQLNGVKPDIVLPDAFDALDHREKFYPYALESGKVDKNAYYKPLAALPLAELSARSAKRVGAENEFIAIRKVLDVLRVRKEKTETIPLKMEAYEQWARQHELELDLSIFQNSGEASKKFIVTNHSLDKSLLQTNAYAREVNSGWIGSISEDIYIQEAFLVLCDLVSLQKPGN
jgi:carboxyl-terminal processing protease